MDDLASIFAQVDAELAQEYDADGKYRPNVPGLYPWHRVHQALKCGVRATKVRVALLAKEHSLPIAMTREDGWFENPMGGVAQNALVRCPGHRTPAPLGFYPGMPTAAEKEKALFRSLRALSQQAVDEFLWAEKDPTDSLVELGDVVHALLDARTASLFSAPVKELFSNYSSSGDDDDPVHATDSDGKPEGPGQGA